MSDSGRRARDTSDDEIGPTSRVVRPRRSIFFEDPDPSDHTDRAEETEPSEDSDPEEEPYEDEEEPHPSSSPAFPPSVPSSPIVPSYSTPSPSIPPPTFTPHRRVDALRWDWMPQVLQWWRRAEKIPILPEVPGLPTPIPPFTQEPVHHTVPVLITRLVTHEDRLDRLDQAMHDRADLPTSEVELLQHQVSEAENDITHIQRTVSAIQDDMTDTREEVTDLHLLLQQAERRAEVAERHAEMMEQRVIVIEQEMAVMRADREQLRADAASSARMVDLLGDMSELLR